MCRVLGIEFFRVQGFWALGFIGFMGFQGVRIRGWGFRVQGLGFSNRVGLCLPGAVGLRCGNSWGKVSGLLGEF